MSREDFLKLYKVCEGLGKNNKMLSKHACLLRR